MTQEKNKTYAIPSRDEIYESLCERHTPLLQEKLSAGRVAVAGLGGLGSTIAVALCRAGVGHLHLIDFDRVDISNLNRQQYRAKDIGRYKTECLQEILPEINPYLEITTDTIKLDETNVATMFAKEDIVCEAFDVADAKAMLVDAFFTAYPSDKILIAGSGMAGYGSSNEIKTRKINERFYLCGDGKSGLEQGMSLMAPRVGVCAAHVANMVIRLLAGEQQV